MVGHIIARKVVLWHFFTIWVVTKTRVTLLCIGDEMLPSYMGGLFHKPWNQHLVMKHVVYWKVSQGFVIVPVAHLLFPTGGTTFRSRQSGRLQGMVLKIDGLMNFHVSFFQPWTCWLFLPHQTKRQLVLVSVDFLFWALDLMNRNDSVIIRI